MAGLAAGAAAAGRLGAAGAAAGRLGAASGAASQAPQAFASIANFTSQMQKIAPILNDANTVVNTLGQSFKTLMGPLSKVAEVAKEMALFVPNATKALIDFGKEISQFVKLANPASVQKFNAAVDDLYAIIGQALAPVLDLVTKAVRNAADSFGFLGRIGAAAARGLEPFQRALETVNEWFGRIGNQLAKLSGAAGTSLAIVGEAVDAFLKALQPLGDLLIDVFGAVIRDIVGTHGPLETATAYVVGFTRALGDLTRWLADAVRQILALVGIDLPNESGTKPGSSTGAAVRNASVSSIDDVLKRALTSAYSLGTGANPAVDTANATKALNEQATKIYGQILEIKTAVVNLPKNLAAAIEGLKDKATNSAAEAIAGPLVDAQDYLQRQRNNVENWLGKNFSFSQ